MTMREKLATVILEKSPWLRPEQLQKMIDLLQPHFDALLYVNPNNAKAQPTTARLPDRTIVPLNHQSRSRGESMIVQMGPDSVSDSAAWSAQSTAVWVDNDRRPLAPEQSQGRKTFKRIRK